MSRKTWTYMMHQHIANLENAKRRHQAEIREREDSIILLQKEINANNEELETVK